MTKNNATVPVYLPDSTVIGRATIDIESGVAKITIQADSTLMELLNEDLVGLSIIYMDRNRVEEIQNKENETDG